MRWTDSDPQEQLYVFYRESGELSQRIEGLPGVVRGLAFSPDGDLVAVVLHSGGLRIYGRSRDWSEVARDEDYPEHSAGVSFAIDGRLATTSYDGSVRLYRSGLKGSVAPIAITTPPLVAKRRRTAVSFRFGLSAHELPVGVAFSPDGSRIGIGYADRAKVALLDGHTLASLKGPELAETGAHELPRVAWSTDGQTLFATGSAPDSSLVLACEDAGSGIVRLLHERPHFASPFIVPLPHNELVIGSQVSIVRLSLDGAVRWTREQRTAQFAGQFDKLLVSPDGKCVGFGFEAFGHIPARFDIENRSLTLSPSSDDKMIVPQQHQLPIKWHNSRMPQLEDLVLPLEPYDTSRSLAICPTGRRFVLGTDWSLCAFTFGGRMLWKRATASAVWATNFTVDGRLIVTACGDGIIRWHRAVDGMELLAFMPLGDRKNWVTWAPRVSMRPA